MKKTTIICVMALLCPRKLKVQSRKREGETFLQGLWSPKLKAYLLLPLLICLNICGKAQTKEKPSPSTEKNSSLSFGEGWGGAFKVGDKLPESFWQQEHSIYQNGKSSKQTLADYKGKLLILDFWATWCGSCINRFPKMQVLQSEYPDKLKILLVNSRISRDGEEQIRNLFTGNTPPFKTFTLPTLYTDDYLTKLFPHRSVPHLVWIDQNGTVVAITSSVLLTSENIKSFIKN